MKNSDKWQPTKFVYKNGKLAGSRDSNELGIASRLMADLIANDYDRFAKEHITGKLLDLGCGKVPLYATYRNFITESICVDWTNSFHSNEYLDLTCDLNNALPFKDNEFDTVILSDVLEHVLNPSSLICEISRILKNSGKVFINVPFFYWLHEQPYDYYRYTEFSLKKFLELADLKILVFKPIGGAPEILADIISKNTQFLPVIGKPLTVLIQATTTKAIKNSIGQKVSASTAKNFPYGYFLIAEKPIK